MNKPTILVFNQVQHKPACTVTDDGWRLEILDVESRGIVISESENKSADQLCSYCEDQPMFSPMQIVGFPMRWLIFLNLI